MALDQSAELMCREESRPTQPTTATFRSRSVKAAIAEELGKARQLF